MMLTEQETKLIEEIIRYCKDIQKLHEQYRSDFEKYETEIAYQYAVNLCLIQIGEATGKLIHIDHVVNEYPEIEWRNIYGLRNRITHGYGSIDQRITFDISMHDIPKLQMDCGQILNGNCLENFLEKQFDDLSKKFKK